MFHFVKKLKLKRLVKKDETSSFIKQYYQKNTKKRSNITTYTVFDLEMTGLDTSKDQILSLAAHKIINNEIDLSQSLSIFVKPDNFQKTGVAEIHGILKKDILAKGISTKKAMQQFIEYIEDSTLVAHGIDLDMAFLKNALKREFNFELINQKIDTMRLVAKKERGVKSIDQSQVPTNHYTLEQCCKRYDIDQTKQHTAIDDAYMTALLYLKVRNQR